MSTAFETLHTFGPEHAGDHAVMLSHFEDELSTRIWALSGVVGEQGIRHGYRPNEDRVYGLENHASVWVIGGYPEETRNDTIVANGRDSSLRPAHTREFSNKDSEDVRRILGGVKWVIGGSGDVAAEVRETVTEWGGSYDMLYYALAHDSADPGRALADPTMIKETIFRKGNLELARHLLNSARAIDELTAYALRNLSFATVADRESLQNFIKARRIVAEHEHTILDLQTGLPINGRIPVVGFPRGRSWYYMNALETDEAKAFGRELGQMREGNPKLAIDELGREAGELSSRKSYADRIITCLEALSAAEQRA